MVADMPLLQIRRFIPSRLMEYKAPVSAIIVLVILPLVPWNICEMETYND
jgi:hypothetical protein